MKGYQTVRAPFAGRVTARFVDPGALVTNAQTNITSALPMMTISDDSRLRVFSYVQQMDVPFVNVGDIAVVTDASNPERSKKAKVTRMTGELEPRTRTMLIEVNIDNADGFFIAGSFAYVTLHVPIKSYPQIPVSGLLVRGNDSFVAMVENDTLRYKPIRVAATDGNTVTVAEGLRQGDRDRDQPAGRGDRRRQGAADPEEVIRGTRPRAHVLAPLAPHRAALAGRRGGRLRRLVAERDPPARQIVRRHLDRDAVADAGADAELAHLPRRVGEDHVFVVELHAEIAVRQFLGDLAFEFEQFFFGHGSSLAFALSSRSLARLHE